MQIGDTHVHQRQKVGIVLDVIVLISRKISIGKPENNPKTLCYSSSNLNRTSSTYKFTPEVNTLLLIKAKSPSKRRSFLGKMSPFKLIYSPILSLVFTIKKIIDFDFKSNH